MRISDWSSDVCSSDLLAFSLDRAWPVVLFSGVPRKRAQRAVHSRYKAGSHRWRRPRLPPVSRQAIHAPACPPHLLPHPLYRSARLFPSPPFPLLPALPFCFLLIFLSLPPFSFSLPSFPSPPST